MATPTAQNSTAPIIDNAAAAVADPAPRTEHRVQASTHTVPASDPSTQRHRSEITSGPSSPGTAHLEDALGTRNASHTVLGTLPANVKTTTMTSHPGTGPSFHLPEHAGGSIPHVTAVPTQIASLRESQVTMPVPIVNVPHTPPPRDPTSGTSSSDHTTTTSSQLEQPHRTSSPPQVISMPIPQPIQPIYYTTTTTTSPQQFYGAPPTTAESPIPITSLPLPLTLTPPPPPTTSSSSSTHTSNPIPLPIQYVHLATSTPPSRTGSPLQYVQIVNGQPVLVQPLSLSLPFTSPYQLTYQQVAIQDQNQVEGYGQVQGQVQTREGSPIVVLQHVPEGQLQGVTSSSSSLTPTLTHARIRPASASVPGPDSLSTPGLSTRQPETKDEDEDEDGDGGGDVPPAVPPKSPRPIPSSYPTYPTYSNPDQARVNSGLIATLPGHVNSSSITTSMNVNDTVAALSGVETGGVGVISPGVVSSVVDATGAVNAPSTSQAVPSQATTNLTTLPVPLPLHPQPLPRHPLSLHTHTQPLPQPLPHTHTQPQRTQHREQRLSWDETVFNPPSSLNGGGGGGGRRVVSGSGSGFGSGNGSGSGFGVGAENGSGVGVGYGNGNRERDGREREGRDGYFPVYSGGGGGSGSGSGSCNQNPNSNQHLNPNSNSNSSNQNPSSNSSNQNPSSHIPPVTRPQRAYSSYRRSTSHQQSHHHHHHLQSQSPGPGQVINLDVDERERDLERGLGEYGYAPGYGYQGRRGSGYSGHTVMPGGRNSVHEFASTTRNYDTPFPPTRNPRIVSVNGGGSGGGRRLSSGVDLSQIPVLVDSEESGGMSGSEQMRIGAGVRRGSRGGGGGSGRHGGGGGGSDDNGGGGGSDNGRDDNGGRGRDGEGRREGGRGGGIWRMLGLSRGRPPMQRKASELVDELSNVSREKSIAERLAPTLEHAEDELRKAQVQAKATGWSLNVAIGAQVILGALTTGVAAATTGRQTSIATSILGGLSTLAASYLAKARGSGEPEVSSLRCKDLENFVRDLQNLRLDRGHLSGGEYDDVVRSFRERFEEIMGNGSGASIGGSGGNMGVGGGGGGGGGAVKIAGEVVRDRVKEEFVGGVAPRLGMQGQEMPGSWKEVEELAYRRAEELERERVGRVGGGVSGKKQDGEKEKGESGGGEKEKETEKEKEKKEESLKVEAHDGQSQPTKRQG